MLRLDARGALKVTIGEDKAEKSQSGAHGWPEVAPCGRDVADELSTGA